jgi:hypothetical protein
VTLPAGNVTLTPVWYTWEPDVTYEPAGAVTQAPAVGGGGVTLTWSPPDTSHTIIGYILEAKAGLTDEFWDRPTGEDLLPPAPCTYTVPLENGFRFFRVTAVVAETEE